MPPMPPFNGQSFDVNSDEHTGRYPNGMSYEEEGRYAWDNRRRHFAGEPSYRANTGRGQRSRIDQSFDVETVRTDDI